VSKTGVEPKFRSAAQHDYQYPGVKNGITSGAGVSSSVVFLTNPRINQRKCNSEHNRTDKNADKTEGKQSTDHAGKNQ
jgi:hypothetical protein